MKFIVTACLLSEMLKPRPKPGTLEFFERSEVVIPFGTYLTIERGLDSLSRVDQVRGVELRCQVESLITRCHILKDHDPAIARVMGEILGHGPLRHTWLPNGKAKEPSYGHYPWVAAASIATDIPIATVKMKELVAVGDRFELPGLYDPVGGRWIRSAVCGHVVFETPPLNDGVSSAR